MTEIQIQLYISQIGWVSPMERIRYYLRDIKHVLFSYFIRNYHSQPELDEDETISDHEKKDLQELKKQAMLAGIPPPEK